MPRLATESPITAPPEKATFRASPMPETEAAWVGADIGAGRRLQAEESGDHGQDRTGQKSHSGSCRQTPPEQEEDHHDEDGQNAVLPAQKHHGAIMDGVGDAAHRLVPNVDLVDESVDQAGGKESGQGHRTHGGDQFSGSKKVRIDHRKPTFQFSGRRLSCLQPLARSMARKWPWVRIVSTARTARSSTESSTRRSSSEKGGEQVIGQISGRRVTRPLRFAAGESVSFPPSE